MLIDQWDEFKLTYLSIPCKPDTINFEKELDALSKKLSELTNKKINLSYKTNHLNVIVGDK